jgi:hypothetical protein
MDQALIDAVKEVYKIKNENLAKEIARSVEAFIESRGLKGHYEGLRMCFGTKYASRELVRKYYSHRGDC